MRGPNLFLVGAQKSGTTSLHFYLKHHQDIFMAEDKELFFFNTLAAVRPISDDYLNHFLDGQECRYLGESSTAYSMSPLYSGTSRRIFDFNPKAKILYIVRNPLDRLISAYWHETQRFRESRAINEITVTSQYALTSNYALQLGEYLRYFPRSQIKIVVFEEFVQGTENKMKEIFYWLGLDDIQDNSLYEVIRNKSPQQVSVLKPSSLAGRFRASWLWRQNLRSFVPGSVRRVLKPYTEIQVDRDDPSLHEQEKLLRQRLEPYFATVVKEFENLSRTDLSVWGF